MLGEDWQARYRAVRLLDETAILACAAYVDLNPIRAAIAETIEDSDYTSAQKLALELQASLSQTSSPERRQFKTMQWFCHHIRRVICLRSI